MAVSMDATTLKLAYHIYYDFLWFECKDTNVGYCFMN